MAYQQESVDLGQVFGAVLTALQQNRHELNEADEYNHDHGDNMVDTFGVITQAIRRTQGAAPSAQLAYAAQSLRQSTSGSARTYAEGLSEASREFQGQQVTRGNALTLIQALLGGGQPAPQPQQSSGGLGDLFGAMLGGQQQQQQSSGGLGDLLGTMLGGQQQPQPQQDDGLDMGDLLKGGLAYMTTKARGGSNLEAIVNAVVAASALGSGYQQQSSSLVVSTLLNAVQGMAGGR